MMIKTDDQIEIMKHGGKILHDVLVDVKPLIVPGANVLDIDRYIDTEIIKRGGEPGFKRVEGYSWATCICINEQIVHAPPRDRILKNGDVVTVDAGVYYKGLHTDSAFTIQIGTKQEPKVEKFIETGYKALKAAIEQATAGNRIGHISAAFQGIIESAGYSIVEELTGHGVGKELHEEPFIPCFLDKPVEKTLLLKPGMVLALEVMYSMGGNELAYERDGWTLKMKDNSLSACVEHTIAITENKTLILT